MVKDQEQAVKLHIREFGFRLVLDMTFKKDP